MRDEADRNPANHRQLAAFRLYLRQIIRDCADHWSGAVGGATNYVEFVRRVEDWRVGRPQEPVVFVTFNYDTLLEDGCRWAGGFNPKTIGEYTSSSAYRVIKPHGSVSWIRRHGAIENTMPEKEIIAAYLADARNLAEPPTQADPDYALGTGSMRDGSAAAFPALAIPLETKSSFECPAAHLADFEQLLPHVDRLIVIGWRGSERHFMERFNGKVQRTIPIQLVGHTSTDELTANLANGLGMVGPWDSVLGGFSQYLRTAALEEFLQLDPAAVSPATVLFPTGHGAYPPLPVT